MRHFAAVVLAIGLEDRLRQVLADGEPVAASRTVEHVLDGQPTRPDMVCK